MEDRQTAALFNQAEACRRAHNWQSAIELLKRVLAKEPEHANAHASLALALLGARRLHAAAAEVEQALAHAPDSPFCHYAAAAVRRGQRRLADAYQHCLVAMQDNDADVDSRVLAASIKALENERDAARALLLEALAIKADDSNALTELARVELHDGNLGEALRRIDTALTADPSDADAHIVAGYIALANGNVSGADEHARFVLANDAASHAALELLTATKTRRNPLLGVWWRWNVLVGNRSETTTIGILLGSFILFRLIYIFLGETGHEDAERIVAQIWLAFCAYTWFAPAIFRWMLQRELKTVVLRDDY